MLRVSVVTPKCLLRSLVKDIRQFESGAFVAKIWKRRREAGEVRRCKMEGVIEVGLTAT